MSADIIARIDAIHKEKNMTERDLARRMGKSDAVISSWTTGFPNLTLRSIAEISAALGEPLIKRPSSLFARFLHVSGEFAYFAGSSGICNERNQVDHRGFDGIDRCVVRTCTSDADRAGAGRTHHSAAY